MPNPTVNPLYIGAIITHRWHLEGIVLFLCSDTVPKGAQSQQVLLSVSAMPCPQWQNKENLWATPAGGAGPSSTLSLLPQFGTRGGHDRWLPGCEKRLFFFFFFKQCFPETCSSHNLLLGARQMVLACWLPSCSLCSQRRGAKWHQGSVSSDGVTSKFTQLQLWGQPPLLLKAGASGTERH